MIVRLSTAVLVACLVCSLSSVIAVTTEDQPQLQTNGHSTFLAVSVQGHCKLTLSEVLETTGTHLSEFEPRIHPTPWELSQLAINSSHFGVAATADSLVAHRLLFTFHMEGETKNLEWARIVPDPRITHADTHDHGAPNQQQKGGHSHKKGEAAHHHEENGEASFAYLSPRGTEFVWIPHGVQRLEVYCGTLNPETRLVIDIARELILNQKLEPSNNNQNSSTHSSKNVPHRRFGVTAANATQPTLKTHRTAGPVDRVDSVVFLSDGYTDPRQFHQTVDLILSFVTDGVEPNLGLIDELRDKSLSSASIDNIGTMKSTVPLDRYLPFWNVYSVYQKSNEAGCSRPLVGETVDDNLKCYHNPQMERALTCDRQLAQALARVSPAPVLSSPDQVLIVVIVNSSMYGGTGVYSKGNIHLGQFYNGLDLLSSNSPESYASLINHEVGHAYGNLFDEYDIGIVTSQDIPLLNCQGPGGNGQISRPIRWQHWIDVFASSTLSAIYRGDSRLPATYGTSPNPYEVCGYSNYYRGSETCMMRDLRSFYMCPQCREGESKAFFLTPYELQWPRYPLADQILLLSSTNASVQGIAAGGATLHLPKGLVPSNNFRVEWYDPNGNLVPGVTSAICPVCLYINASVLSSWPVDTVVSYVAKIYDESIFIYQPMRGNFSAMFQNATFRMKILGNGTELPVNSSYIQSPRSFGSCGYYEYGGVAPVKAQELDNIQLLVQCTPQRPGTNPTCSLDATANVYQQPSDIGSELAQYDSYVLYILGGVGVILVILWLYAAARYKKVAGRVIRPIFKTEFSTAVTIIRRIMMSSSVLFMLGAVGALAAAGYFYTKTSFIGKIIIIGGLFVSLCLYMMAFVGFWAVSNRSKRLVNFNGILMIVGESVLVAALIVTVIIGEQIIDTGSFWSTTLTDWWTGNVADEPETACGWQGLLGCSGWGNYSCNGPWATPVYCPSNCEKYNGEYGTSCMMTIQNIVRDNYLYVAYALAAAVALMGGAIIFNYIYFASLVHLKMMIQKRNKERVQKSVAKKGLSLKDVEKAKALHVLKSLDDGDLDTLVKEFKRIDVDGSGSLSKKELGLFFRKALCYKISLEELNQLFAAMDVDGDNTISIEEFLAVFKSNSNDQKLMLPPLNGEDNYASQPLRPGSNPERERIIRQRLASTFQNSGVFDNEMEPVNAQPIAAAPPPTNYNNNNYNNGFPPQQQQQQQMMFVQQQQPMMMYTAPVQQQQYHHPQQQQQFGYQPTQHRNMSDDLTL